MKKIFLLLVILLPYAVYAQKATIQINTERVIGEIDPNIYGVFMEPIGRNHSTTNIVVGPLYNPSSPNANKDGFNTIIIDAMKELKITNMRWPGGNYISSYNWQDGIGPKELRPVRKDLAWGGFDTNVVGTDEWVALNRAIGSENVICVNLGLGDINGARFWVEYCNIPAGTYYSDLRVKYCLGTSIDSYVQCDTFSTKTNKGIPYLDVTSVYNKEKGSVFVNVVNRNADKAITADISNVATSFTGKAQVNSLEGDAMENFTYAKQDSYKPQVKQIDVKNGILTYAFPAHSITQIELKIK